MRGYFSGRSPIWKIYVGNRPKFSRAILRHPTTFFLDRALALEKDSMFCTSGPFERCVKCLNQSSYAKVVPPASSPAVLTTIVREDAMSTPVTRAYGDSHVRT
jgi:hypothetical protein